MLNRAEYLDCRNCHCLEARRTAQRLTRAYDERLKRSGLTVHQFLMLSVLVLAGPISLTALAEQLGVDRTTLTRNLAVGERERLVTVAPGKDRRMRLVEITQHGRNLADKALPAWREAQAAAGKELDRAHKTTSR